MFVFFFLFFVHLIYLKTVYSYIAVANCEYITDPYILNFFKFFFFFFINKLYNEGNDYWCVITKYFKEIGFLYWHQSFKKCFN